MALAFAFAIALAASPSPLPWRRQDYNFQANFWGAASSNLPELITPFADTLLRLLPLGRARAAAEDWHTARGFFGPAGCCSSVGCCSSSIGCSCSIYSSSLRSVGRAWLTSICVPFFFLPALFFAFFVAFFFVPPAASSP